MGLRLPHANVRGLGGLVECPEVGLPGIPWALGTEGTAGPLPRNCSESSLHPTPHAGLY